MDCSFGSSTKAAESPSTVTVGFSFWVLGSLLVDCKDNRAGFGGCGPGKGLVTSDLLPNEERVSFIVLFSGNLTTSKGVASGMVCDAR